MIKVSFWIVVFWAGASLLFALPLWALWPWSGRALGAPTADYWTFVAVLASLGAVFFALWFSAKVLMGLGAALVERLGER